MSAPGLTRLTDIIPETKLFFGESIEYSTEAMDLLKQADATAVVEEILKAISDKLTEAQAKEIISQVTKNQNVKKGLVMRSLRAGLTGELHGPDLIQSWLLLNYRGLDRIRLAKTLDVITN
jgi:glutamyl-tRNA synthetase